MVILGRLIPQFVPQRNQPAPVRLGVPVVGEIAIVQVGRANAVRMPNRAPILLDRDASARTDANTPFAYPQYTQLSFAIAFRYAGWCGREGRADEGLGAI